jgi:hypothetical protein
MDAVGPMKTTCIQLKAPAAAFRKCFETFPIRGGPEAIQLQALPVWNVRRRTVCRHFGVGLSATVFADTRMPRRAS